MATLHIEHPITDLVSWLRGFGRFAEARKSAGVKAQAFKRFLETKVWASPDMSPGLGGTPRARVLRPVDTGA